MLFCHCFLVVIVVCCLFSYIYCFVFFKQKTAYEMCISDWSSDVCSSDLIAVAGVVRHDEKDVRRLLGLPRSRRGGRQEACCSDRSAEAAVQRGPRMMIGHKTLPELDGQLRLLPTLRSGAVEIHWT